MTFPLTVDDDWPPVSVETLWVEGAGADYKVLNVPFFAQGIALGDIVRGVSEQGELTFNGKVRESGHSTLRVIVLRKHVFEDIERELTGLGCSMEGSPWGSLFAVDVSSNEQLARVQRVLSLRKVAGDLDYEDACLAISDVQRD